MVFGNYQTSFEPLDSQIGKGLAKIMNPELNEQIQEKKNLSMLTTGKITFTIYAFFNINDVKRRIFGMSDLLNMELVTDSLKKYYEAWDNVLMATEEGTRRRSF